MNRQRAGAEQSCGARGPLPRGHLASVAEDFLPAARATAGRPAGAGIGVAVAAPGRADTAVILADLLAAAALGPGLDLGGELASRLTRWEREPQVIEFARRRPLLFWCPVGGEGLSLGSALTLGRIGALLQPQQVTLLWLANADVAPGRPPATRQRERALALARAAVPAAGVNLHCLGWCGRLRRELHDLARRFG